MSCRSNSKRAYARMIASVFQLTANSLVWLAKKTGRTYNEINVLIYYGLIPLSYCVLLDLLWGVHYLKLVFLSFCVGIVIGTPDFKSFSDRLFKRSVQFLNYFNRFGSNYELSSVLICLLIPLLLYMLLIRAVWIN